MDYEKKYKEALGWMQSLYNGLHGKMKEKAEQFFPELCESEDERIRKEIISFIQDDIGEINLKVSGDYDDRDEDDIAHQKWCKKAIAWLEKQGGQKSTEWDEYDEMYVNALVAIVRKRGATDERLRDELIGWLSCLKCRLGE